MTNHPATSAGNGMGPAIDLTKRRQPLSNRLASLVESLIAVHTDDVQTIHATISVPEALTLSRSREETVFCIGKELVQNALRHGMYLRLVGNINLYIYRDASRGLVLKVKNDGWRLEAAHPFGGGLRIVKTLVTAEGGTMAIETGPHTMFNIRLPPETCSPGLFRPDLSASQVTHRSPMNHL